MRRIDTQMHLVDPGKLDEAARALQEENAVCALCPGTFDPHRRRSEEINAPLFDAQAKYPDLFFPFCAVALGYGDTPQTVRTLKERGAREEHTRRITAISGVVPRRTGGPHVPVPAET